MFTGPSLQVIKECLLLAIENGYKDADSAQEIADFCDTNIKSVCGTCGGDGLMDDNTRCEKCSGSGAGPSYQALLPELAERNAKIQKTSKQKLKGGK